MNRRTFITATGSLGLASLIPASAAEQLATTANAPQFTAGSGLGPMFAGSPVVTGPAPDAITILQPLQRHATGYLEYALGNGPFQRVDAAAAGLLPFEPHVLKFRLPPLPPGRDVRYRITARSVGWVQVEVYVHGEIILGEPETGPVHTFRTLNPAAETTTFAVWNDTHETPETLRALHGLTAKLKPDFLLWNGDQANDVHYEKDMAGQFLTPAGLAIADRWPLAYVRGNHDLRGPAARHLPRFTGTPGDRYYYGFRSGPLAALVLDTGEGDYDNGITDFGTMRVEQTRWLAQVAKESWFREAPFKVMFCHIPLWCLHDGTDVDFSQYNKTYRDEWMPPLIAAGIKVIISGHTHEFDWLPAQTGRAIGQLIGGAPYPKYAALIHGTATRDTLTLKMTKLNGTTVADVTLKA